jgi:hypothetical protein
MQYRSISIGSLSEGQFNPYLTNVPDILSALGFWRQCPLDQAHQPLLHALPLA